MGAIRASYRLGLYVIKEIEEGWFMDTGKTTRAAAGALIAIAMLATACRSGAEPPASASGADAGGAGTSGSVATGPSGQADPLVGIWESGPVTAAGVDAVLRGQFDEIAVDEMEGVGGCLPKEGETHVTTLHFGGGQLVISDSKDGGSPHEGWTGSYAVEDSDTFAAGAPDNLYISVNYSVEGDKLSTDLITDRFPDDTPWSDAQDGPGMSKLNGTLGKPLADTMCQAAIYETTSFTRVG
jgi:hypothetical protein